MLKVLKPLLEDNITRKKLRENKIPDSWFSNLIVDKHDLLKDLASYL
jgi:hypothetical protein